MSPTEAEIESILVELAERFERIAPQYRAMLPSRRTVSANVTDLDRTWHAKWSYGELSDIRSGDPDRRADIRIRVASADLVALARGELDFRRAWSQERVQLDASVTDLLRLRAFLRTSG